MTTSQIHMLQACAGDSATAKTLKAIFCQFRDNDIEDEEAMDRIAELLHSLEKDNIHFGDDIYFSDKGERKIDPYDNGCHNNVGELRGWWGGSAQ